MQNFDIDLSNELKTKTNPNSMVFEEVSNAIKDNGGYCCCAMEKTDDTRCMCRNFQEQEHSGFCHCGRFFKVREFPVITILCHPSDIMEANDIAESLTLQGFIVLTPRYGSEGWYLKKKQMLDEIQRTQIYKADVVFVLNSSRAAVDFLEDEIYWAEDLQKKIVYAYTEEVKEDEV